MSIGTKLTEYKLNYIENVGKMDLNPGNSPHQAFDNIVSEYNVSKNSYKIAKNEFKEAEIALQEYENKSLTERVKHPIKNRRLHNKLRNNMKTKKIAMENTKVQYKAKQREMRELKRTIGNQFKAVKDFEKAQKIYKDISNPANSKYVAILPAQRQQIDAWYRNYEAQYNSQKFSASKTQGINTYNKIPSAKSPEFETIKKMNQDLIKSKINEKARNALEKTKDILKPKEKDNDKDEI